VIAVDQGDRDLWTVRHARMRGKKACDPCRYGSCRGPVLIGYFGARPSTRPNLA
jgi:hypothetical protein